MASSGGTTGSAVSGGVGTGIDAVPLPQTLLSLGRYAKIMGVNPLHFFGGYAPDLVPQVAPITECSGVWFHYQWQDADRVSRYDIAEEIANAENDIARIVGFWPAPMFISEESHIYPQPYRREYYTDGRNIRSQIKSIDLESGYIIEPGRRAVSLIGTATTVGGSLAYTDEDSDGFYETATVTLPTTLTDVNEIKVYHNGTSADPRWEIRPVKSKTISGGVVTIVLDAWLFIDPGLYETMVSETEPTAINLSTVANYVTSVDVYREYVDPTQAAVQFIWEPDDVGCLETDAACDEITQNGCMRIRNERNSIVAPAPAAYDATDGRWERENWEGSRGPDRLSAWYLSGKRSQQYMNGLTYEPMSNFWAHTIAVLATSRLERPPCSCGNLQTLYDRLRKDASESTRDSSYFQPVSLLTNPLGTRVGEIETWKRISKIAPRRGRVALA